MDHLREPLSSLVPKLERASKHTDELESEYNTFFLDHPYGIDHKTDTKTNQRVYYLIHLKPIPKVFSVILGDALNNLRSCLDHAVYAMVQVGNPTAVRTPTAICFPIS